MMIFSGFHAIAPPDFLRDAPALCASTAFARRFRQIDGLAPRHAAAADISLPAAPPMMLLALDAATEHNLSDVFFPSSLSPDFRRPPFIDSQVFARDITMPFDFSSESLYQRFRCQPSQYARK